MPIRKADLRPAWHACPLMVEARFAAGERAALPDPGAGWSQLRIMMEP